MMLLAESARSTGSPIATRLFAGLTLMFRLDQTFVPSLAAEALRIAQGATYLRA